MPCVQVLARRSSRADAPPPQVKRLERSGMSQAQAEELTSHICTVVAGTLERLEAKFATKTEAERVRARRWRAGRATTADDGVLHFANTVKLSAGDGVWHVQGVHTDVAGPDADCHEARLRVRASRMRKAAHWCEPRAALAGATFVLRPAPQSSSTRLIKSKLRNAWTSTSKRGASATVRAHASVPAMPLLLTALPLPSAELLTQNNKSIQTGARLSSNACFAAR